MTTAIVSSAIANKPFNGGNAWAVLSWVFGLKRLGFQVYFLEQIGRQACVDRTGGPSSFADSINLAYFREVVSEYGLADCSALILEDGDETSGPSRPDLADLAATTDVLLNISGHLTIDALVGAMRRKVYLDLDPGFTQLWHATGNAGSRLDGHDAYFTVGENIGTDVCSIPTGEIRWRPTRPPVVLDQWPVASSDDPNRFTTVASWRGAFGPVEYHGATYRVKAHEHRKVVSLPELVPEATFELALDIHPADEKDRRALQAHGWKLVDPVATVPDPATFRGYVQRSGAEFSAAQGIYVDTQSGWFSDRTVRYLASGKPVLIQDTGFSRNLPVGEGLVAFRTLDEAIDGAERIRQDYQRHSRAARTIAEACFDSDKVLGRLLDDVGVAP